MRITCPLFECSCFTRCMSTYSIMNDHLLINTSKSSVDLRTLQSDTYKFAIVVHDLHTVNKGTYSLFGIIYLPSWTSPSSHRSCLSKMHISLIRIGEKLISILFKGKQESCVDHEESSSNDLVQVNSIDIDFRSRKSGDLLVIFNVKMIMTINYDISTKYNEFNYRPKQFLFHCFYSFPIKLNHLQDRLFLFHVRVTTKLPQRSPMCRFSCVLMVHSEFAHSFRDRNAP